MVFIVVRLHQKKVGNSTEISVDLCNSFDTVNFTLLWKILKRFGCPPKFLAVLRAILSRRELGTEDGVSVSN